MTRVWPHCSMTRKYIEPAGAVTQERLRELLNYDPLTGIFTWRVKRAAKKPGDIAGCPQKPKAHIVIRIDDRLYLAHRLAWLYMTGRWPAEDTDHRDLDRQNNIWTNLREATPSENMQNIPLKSNNISGYMGVSWYTRDQRWKATIKVGAKLHHIGCFDDPAEAGAAYLEAKARLHPFQPTVPVPALAKTG